MKTSGRPLLPCGAYSCSLEGRQTLVPPALGASSPSAELTVVISGGPHAGQRMTFRVWGEGRVRRAQALRGGDELVINVTHATLESGAVVNRVSDFRRAAAATAVEAFEGRGMAATEPVVVSGCKPVTPTLPDSLADTLRAAMYEDYPLPNGEGGRGAGLAVQPPAFAVDYSLAQHWAGSKSARRRFVDYETVLKQYAECDSAVSTEAPGFLSIFQYSREADDHAQMKEGSLAGYRGRCWARWVAMDLDGDGTEAGLARVLEDTVRLVGGLIALGVPAATVLIFFSGRRGIHIMWPAGVLGAGHKEGFEAAIGVVCNAIAGLVGVTIDTAIYKPLAGLRAPNTRHEDSGLYKVRLCLDELADLDAAAVRERALEPKPFTLPSWPVRVVPVLHDLWRWACDAEAGAPRRAPAMTAGERRIFSDTFDLMIHGAPEGSRGTRFFRAAMNLLDFDCPEPLLHALLEPAARISNYPLNEFVAQLDGAIKAHDAGSTSESV